MSKAHNGGLADSDSEYPSVSATGRYVVFSSWASNLVTPTLTTTDEQVFLLDQGPNFDQHNIEWASVTGPGQSADDACNTTNQAVSADGRYVVYTCSYYSAGWHTNVYLRDRVAMTTTLVSHTPWGTAGDDDSEWAVISADGSTVAFHSDASNLLGADTNGDRVCDTGCDANGYQDVFAYDVATSEITLTSPGLNGAMTDGYSYQPSISTDGRYVAFESDAANLVAGFDPYDSDPNLPLRPLCRPYGTGLGDRDRRAGGLLRLEYFDLGRWTNRGLHDRGHEPGSGSAQLQVRLICTTWSPARTNLPPSRMPAPSATAWCIQP